MHPTLNVLLAQINPMVGAVESNCQQIINVIIDNQARHDLIIFPELALTGYPPEDLLFPTSLHTRTQQALEKICACVTNTTVIVGHPEVKQGHCFNAASVISNQSISLTYHKQALPNYGVFDERRYFTHGHEPCPIIEINQYRLGLCICEDGWEKKPINTLFSSHIDGLISINASPFEYDKHKQREQLMQDFCSTGIFALYINQVGGQDELVFDGQSFAVDKTGTIRAKAKAFEQDALSVSIRGDKLSGSICHDHSSLGLIYNALVCGLRDYVYKNRFPGVLIGLSGGIDSALTAAIAVDALGPDKVHGVLMPSQYTASISNEDAIQLVNNLGIQHSVLPIERSFDAIIDTLAPEFASCAEDVTEENIQARIRGLLLMALSNKFGKLVITTSNKSETAVGYSTLYGDMAGGFGVLKDVLKTQVYQLATYRNQDDLIIPQRIIDRPPSAELRHNQTDQDSLPDYDILDGILKRHLEHYDSADEIISAGYNHQDVQQILHLIKRNEYKRKQSAPGIKISSRTFDKDWRYPITSGF